MLGFVNVEDSAEAAFSVDFYDVTCTFKIGAPKSIDLSDNF